MCKCKILIKVSVVNNVWMFLQDNTENWILSICNLIALQRDHGMALYAVLFCGDSKNVRWNTELQMLGEHTTK
jgi:hypothetical protein